MGGGSAIAEVRGADDAVHRVEATYDVRGMREHLTSYDNPAVGQGNIVNDVLFVYNIFGQLTTDYQSHEDAVNLATSPKVQYTYADGADNTVRPTALVYPNGRELHYNYGSAGEMNDAASRVASLIDDDGTTHLVNYSYLGRGSVVEQESPQPDLLYTLVSLTSSNDPDTGDIYAGLDRFGRVKDLRWRNTNSNTDLSRVEYGYNRATNRIWRKNPTDPNAHYDWLYNYDAIQRLKSGERGTLNSNGTAITDPQFAQCWSLDETGNWRKFLEDDNGDLSWNLNQTRTSSTVNEITNITETAGPSWATPVYSKAGNMTTIPQPADPTASYTATYDAWNRLTKLTDGTDTVQENVYDGRNFRVIQKTYINGDLDETRQNYFTNNWQIIEERLDSSSTPDRHFVWGIRYIDDLICRDRSESDTLDERLYPLPDANWNVTALVNTSGAVAERIEYDPYGHATWLSPTFVAWNNSSYEWETTYCGYRFDIISKTFNVRNRVYHFALGAWVQRDPLGYFDTIGLYRYCKSSPIGIIDPSGLLGVCRDKCSRDREVFVKIAITADGNNPEDLQALKDFAVSTGQLSALYDVLSKNPGGFGWGVGAGDVLPVYISNIDRAGALSRGARKWVLTGKDECKSVSYFCFWTRRDYVKGKEKWHMCETGGGTGILEGVYDVRNIGQESLDACIQEAFDAI